MYSYIIFRLLLANILICITYAFDFGNEEHAKYKIEGRVIRPESLSHKAQEWFGETRIFTNTGHIGFLKEDDSFAINNVPWGSHVVYIVNPSYAFESVRIDINSKGKLRARAVNHVQPSKVDLMAYPLRLRPLGQLQYFQKREEFKITDYLLNPMVLMTLLPLLLIMLVPKVTDPETRKEMEQIQMPKVETPEFAELMTKYFSPGTSSSSSQTKMKVKNVKRKEK